MSRCITCPNEDLTEPHKATDKHRFNYLLYEWTQQRKKLAKNRHGITVSQNIETSTLRSISPVLDVGKGRYTVTLTSNELSSVNNEVDFETTVLNERNEDVMFIMKATVLIPYDAFSISDIENTCINETVVQLKPKQQYKYLITFKLPETLISEYKIPLAFTFQQKSDETISFSMAREIVVVVSDYKAEPVDKSKNPFKFEVWNDVQLYIPPTLAPRYTEHNKIPKNMHRIFMTGLSECRDPNETSLVNHVKDCLCPDWQQTRDFTGKYPKEENYKDFFHFLLWIDEVVQKLLLQGYNMSEVTMNVTPGDMLELEVPGLAEKRPSLIAGDIVKIRFHKSHIVYNAVVAKINDKTIWINKMHPDLLEAVKEDEGIKLDVSFELNRLMYERMHKAVDECVSKNLLQILFPSEDLERIPTMNRFFIPDERFFNRSILNNNEQKTAVLNILNCTSKHAPYIVYGPPGTGKTLTIVEAILQIKEHVLTSKILICAPANAACDMLAEKLIPFVKDPKELIRIHTENRYWDDVPESIKSYSNHNGQKFTKITAEQLKKYRIVITTLALIGKYSGRYEPDYVFIDEAAQAFEPEADIAVSMLNVGKQLILAGDPKQLGPQCASKLAAKHKLESSLLERLMDTNSLYKNGNDRFITMLKLNYRAHPKVLHIPNKLFYDSQLRAVSAEAANDPISKIFIHPLTLPKSKKATKTPGEPIEFCSVVAKERREGKSPSYFNEPEIQMVMKYIKAILSLPGVDVKEQEIGIISPYIRQVHRIKNRLQNNSHANIEVGTTEAFQGREKRIIIISTVRGQNDLLLYDEKYNLGFVKHEKRMNVALTRAKSKLIVIGNPHVLGTDKNWEEYIEYCEENGAFFGAQYLRRTTAVMENIINRFSGIKMRETINVPVEDGNNKNQRRRRKGARAN